ncbi:MAG TPA: hypothetical protein DC056_06760 [Dehalococcoidia bacterium]|nr:hypothetical protein [Dehalococcoidia bacterium]
MRIIVFALIEDRLGVEGRAFPYHFRPHPLLRLSNKLRNLRRCLVQESAMPEAPEMEVVKDYLAQNLVGNEVSEAHVLKPSVLKLLQGVIQEDMIGRTFTK